MSVEFSTHPIWSSTEPRSSSTVSATPFLVSQATDAGDHPVASTSPVYHSPPSLPSERKLSDSSSISNNSLDRHFLRSRSNVSESNAMSGDGLSPTSPTAHMPLASTAPVPPVTNKSSGSSTPSSNYTESSTLPRAKRRSYEPVRDVTIPSLRRTPSFTNIPVQHVISPTGGRSRPLSSSFNISASVPDISELDFTEASSSFPELPPLRRLSSTDRIVRRRSSTDTNHSVTVVTETRTVTRTPSIPSLRSAGSVRDLRRMSTSNLSSFPPVRAVSMVDIPGSYVRRVTETTTTRPEFSSQPGSLVVYDGPGNYTRRVSTEKKTTEKTTTTRPSPARAQSLTKESPVIVRRVISRSPSVCSDSPMLVRRVSTIERRISTPSPVIRRRVSTSTITEKTTTETKKTTEKKTTTRRPSLSLVPTTFTRQVSTEKVPSAPSTLIRRESTETKTTERRTSAPSTNALVRIVNAEPVVNVQKVTTVKQTTAPVQTVVKQVTQNPTSYIRSETTTTTEKKTTGSLPTSTAPISDTLTPYTHKIITETEKKTSTPDTPNSYVRQETTTTTKTSGPNQTITKVVTNKPDILVTEKKTLNPSQTIRRESTTTTEKKTIGSPTPMTSVTPYIHKVITEKTVAPPLTTLLSEYPTSSIRRESTTTETKITEKKTTEKKTIGPASKQDAPASDSVTPYIHKIVTENTSTPAPSIHKIVTENTTPYIHKIVTEDASTPYIHKIVTEDKSTPFLHKIVTENTSTPSVTTVLSDDPKTNIRRESTTTETKITEKKTINPTSKPDSSVPCDSVTPYIHKVVTEETSTPALTSILTDNKTSSIRRESTVTTETKITEKKTTSNSSVKPTVKIVSEKPETCTEITTVKSTAPSSPQIVVDSPGSYIKKVTTEETRTYGSTPTQLVKVLTERPVSYVQKVTTEKTTTEKRRTSDSVPSLALVRLSESPASSIRQVTIEEKTNSLPLVPFKQVIESPMSYTRKITTEKTTKKTTSGPSPVILTEIPTTHIITEKSTSSTSPKMILDSFPEVPAGNYTRVVTEKTTTQSVPTQIKRQVYTHRVESKPQLGVPAITITKPEDLLGTTPFDMTASVKSPSGLTELCDVVSLDDSHYSIKFVPQEMGVHTVSVKHKDMHIPGSPFEFTVGPIAGGGSHKVHAAGPGLERGEVEVNNEFNIYTREAGAGGLSIAVEGPSKAEIDFQDKKDGSCQVSYKVAEPGEYYVSVKFNDEHIPDSPFRVQVSPSIGDARKCSVQSLQDKGLVPNKPAAFVVNFNGAKGRLTARVISPSGAEEEALVQEIDDGQYAVRFIPRENGVHLVHVLFDNYHIPESPFKICVGKHDADAGKVTATGEGLRSGKTGEVAKFKVNTVNAGSGSLAVTVEGPSKVKLECAEVDDGYEFSYKPTAPGDYFICIKYAGTNIAGSPFKAKIEGVGQPSAMQEHASVVVETVTKTSTTTRFSGIQRFSSDASKVTATGKGLTKAFRGQTATFQVDASQAGNNIMYIGMMGPKGPCDELVVKHQGNLVYKVEYKVKETGNYMLIVRWGDQDIPGSPFAVEVQ